MGTIVNAALKNENIILPMTLTFDIYGPYYGVLIQKFGTTVIYPKKMAH